MPPGRYTVRLTAAGKTMTQPLEVLKDPNETVTALDMTASTELLKKVQSDMTTSADMLLTIESVRAQLDSLAAQIGGNSSMADVRAQGDSLGRKFVVVEGNLIDVRMTGRGQDEVRYPAKLGAQLNYLAGGHRGVGLRARGPAAEGRSGAGEAGAGYTRVAAEPDQHGSGQVQHVAAVAGTENDRRDGSGRRVLSRTVRNVVLVCWILFGERTTSEETMRNVKVLLALVLAASAIAGCKKGGGGYIQTAPAPAVAR